MSKLLESLAELEHIQWERWVGCLIQSGKISEEVVDGWKASMIPYSELSEEMKDNDREWARKVIQILLDHGVFIGKNG